VAANDLAAFWHSLDLDGPEADLARLRFFTQLRERCHFKCGY